MSARLSHAFWVHPVSIRFRTSGRSGKGLACAALQSLFGLLVCAALQSLFELVCAALQSLFELVCAALQSLFD
jgi:hypothetical protein